MLKKVIKILTRVAAGLAVAVLVFLLVGFLLMWLWNWLMPDIFGLPTIGYWQAWGLLLLAHILVGGVRSSRNGSSGSRHERGGHREPSVEVCGFRWHMRKKLGKPDEPAEGAGQPEPS